MGFGDFFGIKRKLDFVDDTVNDVPKFIEKTTEGVYKEAKNAISYGLSGEKFLNRPTKYLPLAGLAFGPAAFTQSLAISKLAAPYEKKANLGTRGYKEIEKVPGVGSILADTASGLLSPLSLASLGAGSALAGSSNAGVRALAPAIARGNFAQRVAGEALVGLGANAGIKASNEILPEDTPGGVRFGANLLAGGLGGGLAGGLGNKILIGKPKIPTDPTMPSAYKSYRGSRRVEMEPDEIAQAIGAETKVINTVKLLKDQADNGDEVAQEALTNFTNTLREQYIARYGAPPVRGTKIKTGEASAKFPSPDQQTGELLERSLRNLGEEPNVASLVGKAKVKQPPLQGPPVPPTLGHTTIPSPAVLNKPGPFETVNNILRALWTPVDASPLGIQGMITLVTKPKQWFQALKVAGKSTFDPDYFDNILHNSDYHKNLLRQQGKFVVTSDEWMKSGNLVINPHGVIPGTATANPIEQGLDYLKTKPVIGKATAPVREVVEGSNRFFTAFGNMIRLQAADALVEQLQTPGLKTYLDTGIKQSLSPLDIQNMLPKIGNIANRMSGATANDKLGRWGESLFFAPRFITANVELVLKAAADGTIEGNVARRQLAQWFAIGAGLTFLANESRGKETILDPTDSNFLRIRDVGGTDISPFGYMDTLVRGIALSGSGVAGEIGVANPISGEKGDITDALYLLRSKSSPLVGFGIDLASGQTFSGEDPLSKESLARNLLPFSIREADKEPISSTIAGAIGIKASPLSESESLDKTLEKAGIVRSDPEYDLKRKEYLTAHPEAQPSTSGKYKQSREVTSDIKARRTANEEDTTSNSQTLGDFRERRKELLLEQRAKLEIINAKYSQSSTRTGKWRESYFKLYEAATDPRTKQLDPDKFDSLLADWISANGAEAYDYVLRYNQIGLGPVEKAYSQDLQKLKSLGYFDIQKYRGLTSGTPESELEEIKSRVSAEISVNPRLKQIAEDRWNTAATIVMRELGVDRKTQADVLKIGKKQYTNPAYTKLRAENPDLLQWFNPNATWSTYQKAKQLTARKAS